MTATARATSAPRITIHGGWLSGAFALFALLMSTSAFYDFFTDPTGLGRGELKPSDNAFYQLLWLALYASLALALAISVGRDGLQSSLVLALPLMTIALLSATWSANPVTSLFYAGMLSANILLGYALAQLVPPAQLLRIVGRVVLVLLFISLSLFLAIPELVSGSRYGGGWLSAEELHGVFGHKSDAGLYFALLLLLLASKSLALNFRPAVRIGLAAVTFVGILLANSATALVSVLIFAPLSRLIRAVRSPGSMIAAVACVLIAFSVLVPFIDLGKGVRVVGRDPELTGRHQIWAVAPEFIAARPVLGYGYAGFFEAGDDAPAHELWQRSEFKWFKTPNLHNSALDVMISVGFAGLILYLAVVAGAFSIARNETIDLETRTTLVVFLMVFVLSSSFDFVLLRHNNFATMFLFYCLFASHRAYTPAYIKDSPSTDTSNRHAGTPLSRQHGPKHVDLIGKNTPRGQM